MTSPVPSSPDHAAIWAALDTLADPEIPVVTLRELGIVREIRDGTDHALEVVITPTYSGCPAMGQIEDDVRATLSRLGITARVVTRLTPAWTTDWMSEATKEKLRAYGIAPPRCGSTGAASDARALRFTSHAVGPAIPCPQCGSENTTEISHFGSTACKAQYRCLDCLEPFDYFKPY